MREVFASGNGNRDAHDLWINATCATRYKSHLKTCGKRATRCCLLTAQPLGFIHFEPVVTVIMVTVKDTTERMAPKTTSPLQNL